MGRLTLDIISKINNFLQKQLVLKPVEVHRGGKTFVRRQWVKSDNIVDEYMNQARKFFAEEREKVKKKIDDNITHKIKSYEAVITDCLERGKLSEANKFLEQYREFIKRQLLGGK